MADEKDQNGGAWSKVPTWDDSPQTRRSFQQEMMWWQSALDLESTKKYNLAARWMLRQRGVVCQRGEEFIPEELAYQKEVKGPDPIDGQGEVVLTPEDPLSGLKKPMNALEGINGRTDLDKKGEIRSQLYIDCNRRPGERIAEFSARFRTLLADLKTEGVTLPTGEVGWFFKQKLCLDPLLLQLLETALAGAEGYEEAEREVFRLLKDVCPQDSLARKIAADGNRGPPLLKRFLNQSSTASRPSSYAPSTASSAPRSFRSTSSAASQRSSQPFRKFGGQQKQALVSEVEENELAKADEHDPETVEDETDLAEALKCEAEAFAAELDDAAELGVDAETLREVEDTWRMRLKPWWQWKRPDQTGRSQAWPRLLPCSACGRQVQIELQEAEEQLLWLWLARPLGWRQGVSQAGCEAWTKAEASADCWSNDHRALCEWKACGWRRNPGSFDCCRPALVPISGGCCPRVSLKWSPKRRTWLPCPHCWQKTVWCVGLCMQSHLHWSWLASWLSHKFAKRPWRDPKLGAIKARAWYVSFWKRWRQGFFGEMAAADRHWGSSCQFLDFIDRCAFFGTFAGQRFFWKQLVPTFHFCGVNCDVNVWMASLLHSSSSLQVTTCCHWCMAYRGDTQMEANGSWRCCRVAEGCKELVWSSHERLKGSKGFQTWSHAHWEKFRSWQVVLLSDDCWTASTCGSRTWHASCCWAISYNDT